MRALTPYHVWRPSVRWFFLSLSLSRSQGNVLRAERTSIARQIDTCHTHAHSPTFWRAPSTFPSSRRAGPPLLAVPVGECRRQHLSSPPPGKASACPPLTLRRATGNSRQRGGSSSLLRLNGEHARQASQVDVPVTIVAAACACVCEAGGRASKHPGRERGESAFRRGGFGRRRAGKQQNQRQQMVPLSVRPGEEDQCEEEDLKMASFAFLGLRVGAPVQGGQLMTVWRQERETECKQLSLPLSPFHVAIHNTKLAGSL